MRILFIGGTGNISTECAASLHKRGHEILILSRGRSPVPSEYRAIKSDRKDLPEMRAVLASTRPEVVINFIGFEPSEIKIDCELFQSDNLRQYIFISSTTVYSKPPRHLPIKEDAPLGNPWWDYAQKKLNAKIC